MLLQIVYFSTEYSTAWTVFTVVFVAVTILSSFILYANHVSLARKLRAEKTGSFWMGLFLVIFIGGVFLGSPIWKLTNDYLFPYYPRGIAVSPVPILIVGLLFTGAGLVMMAIGTAQQSATKKETIE
jgi:hypothetical protein